MEMAEPGSMRTPPSTSSRDLMNEPDGPNPATQLADDHFLCEVDVVNEMGMHARPASLFVGLAIRHECDVSIRAAHQGEPPGERVDGKSILQLLSLSAECGTTLTIETRGVGAARAILELRDLVRRGFGDASQEPAQGGTDPSAGAEPRR